MATIKVKETARVRLDIKTVNKDKLIAASKATNKTRTEIVDELIEDMTVPRNR